MECRCSAGRAMRLALAAFLVPGSATYVRRASTAPQKSGVAGALRGHELETEAKQTTLHDFVSDPWRLLSTLRAAVLVREPEARFNSTHVGKGEQPQQPVSMQVPQEQLDQVAQKLSPRCKERFHTMLSNDGPGLHDFSSTGGPNATLASCQGLNGSVCATEASVSQYMATNNGRKMRTSTEVEGHGCLPSECVEAQDLQVLAGFMQLKAKELIPGMGVSIALRVNCTQSGGSTAAVGADEAAAGKSKDAAAAHVNESQKSD